MQSDLTFYMNLYKEYTDLFYKQVMEPTVFKDFVNTDKWEDEYLQYMEKVYSRIFNFKTWFEHTQNFPFPSEWEQYSDFFFPINA